MPADVFVDRDEHLAAGTLLPMPGMNGFRLHASEEPLRGGVVRRTAFRARRPCQAVAAHGRQPSGHRQWHPRSERTRGCTPSGSDSTALTSILSASPALGPEPAVYAMILPSWQPIIGERCTFPSLALISVMSVNHFPFGIPTVKSRLTRLPGAGVVSPSYEPYPRRSGTCAVRQSSAMIPRSTFSETRVRSAALTLRYPYPPLEEANASATRTCSPAHLSAPSLAWWQ